jgi:hypothetical protein
MAAYGLVYSCYLSQAPFVFRYCRVDFCFLVLSLEFVCSSKTDSVRSISVSFASIKNASSELNDRPSDFARVFSLAYSVSGNDTCVAIAMGKSRCTYPDYMADTYL